MSEIYGTLFNMHEGSFSISNIYLKKKLSLAAKANTLVWVILCLQELDETSNME